MLARQRKTAAEETLAAAQGSLAGSHAELARSRTEGLDLLAHRVEELWDDYLTRLRRLCSESVATGLMERLDRALRTDRDEYMDRPEFPEAQRERAVRDLHRFNSRVGTYRRSFGMLEPTLETARKRRGGAPRMLDLASGHGGFPLMMAEEARRRGVALRVSGSDVQPGHVARASERARRKGLDVGFRLVNAFDMSDVPEGDYDVLTILQAIHHFRPGQLARMIAEGLRVASTAFVGIDAVRSPWLPPFIGIPTFLISGNYHFAHDGFVSGRKMYDAAELGLIARAVAPGAQVRVTRHPPFNRLEVLKATA